MNALLDTLSNRYTIDGPFSIVEFWSSPSAELYRTVHRLRQESFAANHRIVFTCFDELDDHRIREFLIKLQKCLTFVDISNCFVLIVSNRPWINEYLNEVKNQWAGATEQHTIEHEFYDVPTAPVDFDFSAILNPPDTICAQPWISLDVSTSGRLRPCCYFEGNIKQEDGSDYHINDHSLEQVYNSKYMKDLRQRFVQGDRPKACGMCWTDERNGSKSKRMLLKHRFIPYSYDANWEQDDIRNLKFVSVHAGNICNLKCRICSPGNSSKIAEEQLRQIPLQERKTHEVYKKLVSGRWVEDTKVWNKLTDSDINIEYFDFAGGEPMLQLQHFSALEKIIDQDRAPRVQLHYNTNGTIFPSQHAELWKKFKMVNISLSIDNIQDRFEVERSGMGWSVLQTNLDKFFSLRSHNIKISLNLSVNIQNVLYLPEICNWIESQSFDSVHFNHVYDPEIFYIGNVTATAQSKILERLDAYVCDNSVLQSFVNTSAEIVRFADLSNGIEFCKYMKHLDNLRNQDFSQTHREIASAMGY